MDRGKGRYKDDTVAVLEDRYKECTSVPAKYGDIADIEHPKTMLGMQLLVKGDMHSFLGIRKDLERKIIEMHRGKGTKYEMIEYLKESTDVKNIIHHLPSSTSPTWII